MIVFPQGTGTPFDATSRYYNLPTRTFVDASNQSHVYVARRFIPPPDAFAQIGTHVVMQGERYDAIAATYLGDPTQFWQLCDANALMDPLSLQVTGTIIVITLPAGIPGYPGD